MTFDGFIPPTKTFFQMPNEWIDICAGIDNLAELKVVQYALRHTWGYHEYGIKKTISIDEFMYGRKHTDGTRMDKGTGLKSSRSVKDGLKAAIAHGYLECETDTKDMGRIKKSYAPRMQKQQVPGVDTTQVDTTHLDNNIYPSDSQHLPIRDAKTTHRTEKDTIERYFKKDTLEREGREQQQPETHARSLSNISSSLSLEDHLPENVSSFSKPQEKETVQLTEKQRRRAEEEGRRAREIEIWAIVEEGRKTTYSSRQRTSKKHTEGLSGLIEDGVADTTIRHGLSVLSEWEKEAFCLNAFYEWLPNLRTRVPGTAVGRHLKAVVNGNNNNHTNGNHYSSMTTTTTNPDAYVNPHYGAPPGMLFWKGQLVTEDDAYADGYNGGFERYK